MNPQLFAFGIPATIGLFVALFILYRVWWKKRLLLKDRINGTKLLIVKRDLGTIRLLATVELLFFLAFLTTIILPFLPDIAGEVVLWYVVAGSIFVTLAILHIYWAQNRIDKIVEEELLTKQPDSGSTVTIEVTGKVISPNQEGGDTNGDLEIS